MKWECSSTRSNEVKESNRLKSDVLGDSFKGCLNSNLLTPIFKLFSVEGAMIHAHLCGDGCVWREYRKRSPADLATHKRRNAYREFWWLTYTNTKKILRDEFESAMIRAFNRKLIRHQVIDLKTGSVKNILMRLKLIGKNSHNWHIPEEILLNKQKVKASWLRTFFDDEATVSLEKKSIRLKIVNQKGLSQIQKLLTDLGIESNITGPNCDKTWFLNIRHKDIINFSKLVGFNHPKQKYKLEKLVEIIKLTNT